MILFTSHQKDSSPDTSYEKYGPMKQVLKICENNIWIESGICVIIIEDPLKMPPGYEFPHAQWTVLNRIRTKHAIISCMSGEWLNFVNTTAVQIIRWGLLLKSV